MDECNVIKREALYEKVWSAVEVILTTAPPGAITAETFSRMAVDIVLTELLRAGSILPSFIKAERAKLQPRSDDNKEA